MAKRFAARLLAAAAAASILATILAIVAGGVWPMELATHFRVQYLVAQLLLGAGLIALGRHRWVIALGPAIAVNALVVLPHALPQAQAQPASAGAPLTLLGVNLSARNRSFDRLVETVSREDPDVLLLVEYTPWAAAGLQALDSAYPYALRSPQSNPFGIALLSKLPIVEARVTKLGATDAIDATLAGPAGPFRLLGVHLLPPTSADWFRARNLQLEELARLTLGSAPLVVLGDFNVSPYSRYFTDWLADTGLRDTLAGRGIDFSWPSFFPPFGIAIDHCMVSAEFAVLGRRRLANFGSDHLPILIELDQGNTL